MQPGPASSRLSVVDQGKQYVASIVSQVAQRTPRRLAILIVTKYVIPFISICQKSAVLIVTKYIPKNVGVMLIGTKYTIPFTSLPKETGPDGDYDQVGIQNKLSFSLDLWDACFSSLVDRVQAWPRTMLPLSRQFV
mmetsp:Transcript_2413/g.4747  ORF Transcript_2413/g.4747 Transcript_2413/m.4747 type:complete len:136 (+) Transcript_2413:4411-4818(+)